MEQPVLTEEKEKQPPDSDIFSNTSVSIAHLTSENDTEASKSIVQRGESMYSPTKAAT